MAEQFDILDKNGTPTGETVDKGAQLKDGQYYLGIHAYIYNSSGEFLVQQRSYNKAFLPGGWDVVLEHVIAGESSKDGAIRGIREEIGLSVSENINFVGRFIWESYHHMIDVYFIQVEFDTQKLSLQSEEVIGVKTIAKQEMLDLVQKMDYRPVGYRELIVSKISKMR